MLEVRRMAASRSRRGRRSGCRPACARGRSAGRSIHRAPETRTRDRGMPRMAGHRWG